MQVADNKVVWIDYTLTNDAGEVLDSSKGEEPLPYLHGHDNIIPGLEKALAGKSVGDSLVVTIPAAEGYGEYDDELVQVVSREMFDGVEEMEVGMQFQAETEDGIDEVTVVEIDGDNITVDGNHPFAGMNLTFEVTISDMRDATEEELAHGHVHMGSGNHCH